MEQIRKKTMTLFETVVQRIVTLARMTEEQAYLYIFFLKGQNKFLSVSPNKTSFIFLLANKLGKMILPLQKRWGYLSCRPVFKRFFSLSRNITLFLPHRLLCSILASTYCHLVELFVFKQHKAFIFGYFLEDVIVPKVLSLGKLSNCSF
uniref:Uncharacterized protein n=1 Tax=Micrurus spixii TaxID=129469 RepID=A0A2D4LBZ4_9SAUR